MRRVTVFAVRIMRTAHGLTGFRGARLLSFTIGCVVIVPLVLSTLGCSKRPAAAPRAHARPEAKAVKVEKRTIVRTTNHPGFIEAYEQTAIYPKIAGFIDEWKVDIGDPIARGMKLAHLDVPDLLAQYEEKKAEVAFDDVRIKVAERLVEVAEENWKTATAQVDEAKANLGKEKAEVERWTADYQRISLLRKNNAIDETVEDESRRRMQVTIASQHAAEAGIVVAKATEAARKADVDKARIDVDAARARAKVARATEKRLAATVGYTTVQAPYDGIVLVRNVNTGDFAQPAAGDPSAQQNNPLMQRASSNPLYVVARTDKVRIFLDVPEMEANGIHAGSIAHVKIEAVDNMEFSAEVTRTSWALNAKSRTLRVEIDIPNPQVPNPWPEKTLPILGASILGLMESPQGRSSALTASALISGRPDKGRILPNMYAYGTVELKRADVWAIPLEAVFQLGNQDYCYVLEGGKAVQVPVQVGIDDGTWVEVAKKRSGDKWLPFDGTEQVLTGELSQFSNGEPVRVNTSASASK